MDISEIDLSQLIGRDTKLKRVSGTNGGEWHGPCPRCGGRDRFLVQPARRADRGCWSCRQCHPSWGDAVDYIQFRDAVDYAEALSRLGIEINAPMTNHDDKQQIAAPSPCEAPGRLWQESGTAWLERCQVALWDVTKPRALDWLRGRGLSLETITRAGLGAWHENEPGLPDWQLLPAWGLTTGDWADDDATGVWLPRGIVIPWSCEGQLWKLAIRRPAGDLKRKQDAKYITVRGSSNALYGVDQLAPGKPAVIVEGVLDALAVQQEAGDLVTAVAAGTSGARHLYWYLRLQRCPDILVGLDNDQPGELASEHWMGVFPSQALRWRPFLNDPADMLEKGMSIRAWIEQGLAARQEAA